MHNRRQLLRNGLLGLGTLALGRSLTITQQAARPGESLFKHSACRWCYADIPLEALCERGQDLGLHSIELLTLPEWKIVQAHGLECAVATHDRVSLTVGFNDPSQHADLYATYSPLIRQAADDGIPQVIVFSGNRRGISDLAGLEHCARGLDPLVKEAEAAGVTLTMELFNSKVNHPDYQCDSTGWGAALVDKIGSPRFKLLYDIYHMQIMEGDIIATIRRYHDYFSHYHTGGVPGRHEINDSQELNYPAIVRAIQQTDYRGYIGQEFIPTYDDKMAALAEGLRICSV